MDQATLDKLRKNSFRTFYKSYYQELVSGKLGLRWQRIDSPIGILVALTASGSAVAVFTLWSQPGWNVLWGIIAGIASVASIAHSALGVPARIKQQEDLRRDFSKLRVDLETFYDNLSLNLDAVATEKQYSDLRERFSQLTDRTHPDIAFTLELRKQIQAELDDMLKEEGRIQ